MGLQVEVDRLYDIFVGHVAQARGLESEAIRGLEAGLVFGDAAVTAGLADAVTSFEEVISAFALTLEARRRLTANGARASPTGASTTNPVPHNPILETSMNQTSTTELPDTTPSES